MGRRRRFDKPSDLIGSAGKRRAMALKVQPQIAATAINTRLATRACQFMLIGTVRKMRPRMQRKGAKEKKKKKCVDKEAEATLSTLSQRTVVRVRAVMGRLIGLAGDTEDVPW